MKNSGNYIPAKPADRAEPCDKNGQGQLAELRRKIQTLCRRAQEIEEIAQDLQFQVDGLRDQDLSAWRRHAPSGPRRPANDEDTEALKKLADLGAAVTINRFSDGSATVIVEHSQRARLTSPSLADLLEILCDDCEPRCDGLVGWKSLPEIAARLQKKTGKGISPHAISVRIARLRALLGAAGINRFYIQTNRRIRGFRFARKVEDSCPAEKFQPQLLGS